MAVKVVERRIELHSWSPVCINVLSNLPLSLKEKEKKKRAVMDDAGVVYYVVIYLLWFWCNYYVCDECAFG